MNNLKIHGEGNIQNNISFSVSDYQRICTELINHASQRPSSFFTDLEEFRAFLSGHMFAFFNLKVITGDDSFNTCFTEWLCEKTDSSGPSGWAYVISELANKIGVDPEALFFKYVQEFLEQWGTES